MVVPPIGDFPKVIHEMKTRALIAAIVLSASAFGTDSKKPTSAEEVSKTCKLAEDPYDKSISISGPTFDCQGASICSAFLESLRTKSGVNIIRLVAMTSHSELHLYDRAFDKEGTKFPVVSLKRQIVASEVAEIVAIPIARDYLGKHTESGIDIKLYGKGGTQVVTLPGFYLVGFLSAAKD